MRDFPSLSFSTSLRSVIVVGRYQDCTSSFVFVRDKGFLEGLTDFVHSFLSEARGGERPVSPLRGSANMGRLSRTLIYHGYYICQVQVGRTLFVNGSQQVRTYNATQQKEVQLAIALTTYATLCFHACEKILIVRTMRSQQKEVLLRSCLIHP